MIAKRYTPILCVGWAGLTLTGERTTDPDCDLRSKVELHEDPGERGSWEEQKGIGCKYFRNVATSGFLGWLFKMNKSKL